MRQPARLRSLFILVFGVSLCLNGLSACALDAPDAALPVDPPSLAGTPDATVAKVKGQAGTLQIALSPGVPDRVVSDVRSALAEAGWRSVETAAGAGLLLTTENPGPDSSSRLACERIYVPVDRFSTVLDGITLDELRGAWAGTAATPNFTTIYPAAEGMPDLTALLGSPGPAVKPRPADSVADALWSDRMGLGIVPFENLSLRTRALRLDGLSAVDNRLPQGRWPLASRAWLRATSPAGTAALGRLPAGPLQTDRDPARLTVVTMTGVTALARGTAAAIARAGDPAFPARRVGPELAAADITTTSNEVSFVDGCVPDNRAGVATFCADPSYFATLELSGVKLVGLTGNHLNDFGTAAFLSTLDLYNARGIQVYGGGRNDTEARAPLIVRDHGNTLAFIGANQFGPAETYTHDGEKVSAWADQDGPGSARFDREQMAAAVEGLRSQGGVIFAELQYFETNAAGDYQTEPVPGQRDDFRAVLDAGADVVTGVQAHAPQAVELRGRGLILYGLGNLYFDQTWSWPTSTGLVARHTVYAGRLINTELLVTVIDSNMQVRWATPDERTRVLRAVFAASGW